MAMLFLSTMTYLMSIKFFVYRGLIGKAQRAAETSSSLLTVAIAGFPHLPLSQRELPPRTFGGMCVSLRAH